MLRRSHFELETPAPDGEPGLNTSVLAMLGGIGVLALGLVLFLVLGGSGEPTTPAQVSNPYQQNSPAAPPTGKPLPTRPRRAGDAHPARAERTPEGVVVVEEEVAPATEVALPQGDATASTQPSAKQNSGPPVIVGFPDPAAKGGLAPELTGAQGFPAAQAGQASQSSQAGQLSGQVEAEVLEEYPEDNEELPSQIRLPTQYVDLPATPRNTDGITPVVLVEGLGQGPCELRLLGADEQHPAVVWEHEKEDLQRVIVYGIPDNPDSPREVLARFFVQQGKLMFLWSFQPSGMMRRYQDVPRECVLEVTDQRGTVLELVALRAPVNWKPERIERLLKGDKIMKLGYAIPGLKQRRIYLDTCQLSIGGKRYLSEPVSIATKENREALPDKAPEDERPMTPIGDSGGPPAQRAAQLAKKKAAEQRYGNASKPAASKETGGYVAGRPEPRVDLKVRDIARMHVRQQSFPEAAKDVGMPMVFFEEFPHADHLTLRIDTQPSYVGYLNRMLGARSRLSELETSIKMHMKEIAKLQTAITYWSAQSGNNVQGTVALRAVVAQAQADMQQENSLIALLEAKKPHWQKKEAEARVSYETIKLSLEVFASGSITGTFYRIVDDVRVDVLRVGPVARKAE